MLSERSLLFAFGGGFNSIDKELSGIGSNLSTTPSPTAAAAAAAYIYLEKVKEEKLSPHLTEASGTKVSSEADLNSLNNAIMESATSNNNNNGNRNPKHNNHKSSNKNNVANNIMINHVQNALGGSSSGLTISTTTSNHSHQQQSLHSNPQQHQSAQKQPQKAIASNVGVVKREGLSPGTGTNGDLRSSVSRSRSTTPSSFRGTSPQQISTETLMPLTSLLRIQQAASSERRNSSAIGATMDTTNVVSTNATLPTDFSTRNYSDIMRSLAAKYNDSNPNNSSSRRNIFFDTSSACATPVANNNINQQTGNRNAAAAVLQSALPKKDTHSQIMQPLSMSPGEVAVAAAAASFLSNLPFSQSVCPPLIDMSSTQALVTLARAAKEAEVQTILRYSQQNLKPINSTSLLPHPNLTVALQQAAQFVSPALIYSAQLQQQHQTPSSRQSSPLHKLNNASSNLSGSAQKTKSTAATSTTTVPLDLSSQPPAAKRFKVDLNVASSNKESDGLNVPIGNASSNLAIVNDLFFRSSTSIQRTPSNTPEKFNDTRMSVSPAPATTRQSPVVRQCQAQSEEVSQWNIDDVCAFVGDIDICADYVQHFRDQRIDGSGLPLLTEEHLLNSLGMKLGPALKLRSMLAKKLGGPCPCVACITQARQMLALQTAAENGAVRPGAASAEETAAAGGTSTSERSSDIANITDTKDKEKQNHENWQEGQKMHQVTEQRRPSISSNNEGDGSCAALTLQICANIYKNEANSKNHENEKVNNENKRISENIVNKTTGSSTDAATDSIANKDCKSNSRNGGSSNTKNGSLQRTGSGDIADVGS